MAGFGKFISVVMFVCCALAIICGIGGVSDAHGTEQDILILGTVVSVAVLAGLASLVWNIAAIAERMTPAESEQRVSASSKQSWEV